MTHLPTKIAGRAGSGTPCRPASGTQAGPSEPARQGAVAPRSLPGALARSRPVGRHADGSGASTTPTTRKDR